MYGTRGKSPCQSYNKTHTTELCCIIITLELFKTEHFYLCVKSPKFDFFL